MFDNQHCVHLRVVIGEVKVFQRSEYNYLRFGSGFNFYVPVDMDLKIVDNVDSLIETKNKFKDLRNCQVIVKGENGEKELARIQHIDLEKSIESGEVHVQAQNHLVKLSEADFTRETSGPENLAMAKKIAKTYGLTVVNEKDVLEDESEPELNLLKFDFYRNICGDVYIEPKNYKKFEKDLLKLVEKYHVPLCEPSIELDKEDQLHNFSMDSDKMQVYFSENGENLDEIFHDSRGAINGAKFGI